MIRYFPIILIASICLGTSIPVLADEAADVQAIKSVLTGAEESLWVGNVEKIISYFSSDFFSCVPNSDKVDEVRADEIVDPVNFEITDSGPEAVKRYAEMHRTYPDYQKKYPNFKHRNIVEQVSVMGDIAIAVDKRIREWPDDKTNENVRETYRNLYTLRKINGEWKITGWFARFSAGRQAVKMRPPK